MESVLWVGLLLAPALWCAPLLLSASRANAWSHGVAAMARAGCGVAAFAAAVAGCLAISGAPVEFGGSPLFFLDALSALMLSLVAFLGWVIVRFSWRYMDGDPRRGEFIRWLAAALAAVFVLVTAGHFALLVAAWVAMSLALHQLLAFYPDRPAAVLSARKKFLFSRVADLCLIAAAVLLGLRFGSLDLAMLLNETRGLSPGEGGPIVGMIAILLGAAAVLKSAQFPFHTWLPDTLETPTPVSALMHAGIVSAGGFLLIRMSPVLAAAPEVLLVLAVTGAITAVFGSLVMLTQTSIKKALAFSTVAQMGYMMLQCGLGAFALAALHLVAHSLYKAHAFLASGNAVTGPSGKTPHRPRPPSALSLVAWVVGGVSITVATGMLFGVSLAKEPGLIVFGTVLALAVATLLQTARGPVSAMLATVIAVAVSLAYFVLHHLAVTLLAGVVPATPPPVSIPAMVTMASILLLFVMAFILQSLTGALGASRWGQHLYVLIFNRFYLNACVNRLLTRLRPVART